MKSYHALNVTNDAEVNVIKEGDSTILTIEDENQIIRLYFKNKKGNEDE